MKTIFANILYDDTFKVVVCAPGNEALLIGLIETLIPGKSIRSLKIIDKEQFIVEMQNAPQRNYADRMLSYATYPIRNQLAVKLDKTANGETEGRRVLSTTY